MSFLNYTNVWFPVNPVAGLHYKNDYMCKWNCAGADTMLIWIYILDERVYKIQKG